MPEILIDKVLGPLSLASNPEWPGDSELTLRLVSPCLPGGGSRRDGLQGRKHLQASLSSLPVQGLSLRAPSGSEGFRSSQVFRTLLSEQLFVLYWGLQAL